MTPGVYTRTLHRFAFVLSLYLPCATSHSLPLCRSGAHAGCITRCPSSWCTVNSNRLRFSADTVAAGHLPADGSPGTTHS